ncbi:glycerol-3-phosphate dehydrogenase/oxidase [Antricoccus suffuscus]|uniref:glycerol-3-phosphate dehydrogenase/oxidase n=1 Tax=Antricoccus suffuscus TaxID=1629062 RepID=UPI001EDECEFA|nr:glycerol-3-phosphate dehydrogenase/oxidase [Antricoccus suffuscus]
MGITESRNIVSLHWPSLTADRRQRDLDSLASGETIDVLVIGGGITGAGVALDAASRGLSTVLVEQSDLASGTSSYSSGLVHGGLRYLASRQINVAVESATERGILMERTAPHLVRSLPMLMPDLADIPAKRRRLARLGFQAGDLLRASVRTNKSLLPAPRRISGAEAKLLFPTVRADSGLLSFDGQLEDDCRLVIAVARTAAAYGAKILPRVTARWIAGDGAQVRDELTGLETRINARSVVNATGVWAGKLEPGVRLRARRGSHIIVPTSTLRDPRAALVVPVDGTFHELVSVLPQSDGTTYIGTTDVLVDDIGARVQPTADDVDFLLATANKALEVALTRDDVVGQFAGLRPVTIDDEGVEVDLSRKHQISIGDTGALTIVGGKLTTYRKMAEEAVDKAVEIAGIWAADCQTRALPLVGAASRDRLAEIKAPQRLIDRYGVEAEQLVALAADNKDLAAPVVAGSPVTRAELVFGVQNELAMTPEDLVDRRTRLGLVDGQRAEALEVATSLLAHAV